MQRPPPRTSLRRLRAFAFAFILALISALPALAALAASVGSGVLEAVKLDPEQRQLMLSGWAAPERPGLFVTQLIVRIGGETIYRGRLLRGPRPDVVRATGRLDWQESGFAMLIALPPGTPVGLQSLAVSVRLGDGSEFDLRAAPGLSANVDVPPLSWPPKRTLLLGGLALALPLALWLAAGPVARLFATRLVARQRAARGSSPSAACGWFGGAIALSFALLVAGGITGSSLELLLDEPAVTTNDAPIWWGQARPVRSDEWGVITPLAIAQTRHQPTFPLVNRNVGEDGANMLVIGMTGVPVAHLSALAKPATWGFFVFDLKRALAWYWWFPFFACFAAVWALLLRLFALDWKMAAALALTVSAAPYSVVYSGWPAYTVFFPVLALVLADVAWRTRRAAVAAGVGALLGLALCGFALVLYPAWQITVAWLLGAVALGWFWRERRQLNFGAAQLIALAVAVAVLVLVLGSWWLDAKDAVEAMRATVYPGQRSTEVGGDAEPWFLVKGLLSPITMYADSPVTNAADAGSFVFLLLPLAVGLLAAWFAERWVDPVSAAAAAFIACALAYLFVGFTPALAQWTLWSRATSYRLDLALGLAQLLLIGWLLAPARADAPAPRWFGAMAGLVALVSVLLAVWQTRMIPPQIGGLLSPAMVLLIGAALAACAWLLVERRWHGFALLFCCWTLAASLPFNPIGQAPKSIELLPELARADLASASADGLRGVAVLDNVRWSLALPAAGMPVVNSVFYDPQDSLWHRLDSTGALQIVYNRYQRRLFVTAPLEEGGPAFQIDSPRLDEVRVTLDPARFDFALLGARFVLTPPRDAAALAGNPSLRRMQLTERHALFGVVDKTSR